MTPEDSSTQIIPENAAKTGPLTKEHGRLVAKHLLERAQSKEFRDQVAQIVELWEENEIK